MSQNRRRRPQFTVKFASEFPSVRTVLWSAHGVIQVRINLIALTGFRLISCRALVSLAVVCMIVGSNEAIAADAIVPSAKLPTSIPWDLKKLNEPPVFEWIDDKGPVRSLFYEGESYGGKPTRVFAYYATPATVDINSAEDQRFPAVVLLHGGGGTAFREWVQMWVKRGYAAIAMDLAGSRPMEGKSPHEPKNRVRLVDGGPDQGEEKFGNIDKAVTEQWSYHAVAAAIRAHSLIRSFPEVDAERTAVTGISWGGYLTSIVAGVDNRFEAAVPVYGCGFLHENSAWLEQFAKMTFGTARPMGQVMGSVGLFASSKDAYPFHQWH